MHCAEVGAGQQRVRDAFGQFVACVPSLGHAEHDLQWENQSPQDGHDPYDRADFSRAVAVALALSLVSVRTAAVGFTALSWDDRTGSGWARRAPSPPRWVMA